MEKLYTAAVRVSCVVGEVALFAIVAIFLVRESDDGAMDERFGRLEGLPK